VREFIGILLGVDIVVLNWILFAYASFIFLFSLMVEATFSPLLMSLCFVLYILSLKFPIHKGFDAWVRLFLICCLHWVSHSNGCLPLYLLTLVRDTYNEEQRVKAWSLSFAYATVYLLTSFSLSEAELSLRIWLQDIFNLIHFLFAILLSRTILTTVKQTEMLRNEQKIYSTHDALTGLYNYEECHRKLEELVIQNRPMTLIIIDCTDLKSMNTSKGFQAGNLILKQVSELLKILFSEALFISRYGGDEFAIVMPLEDRIRSIKSIRQHLDSELPKLTGIQITYGISMFPQDGLTKDDLILNAEHNLFMKKREMWLKREEHMLRSEKLRVVGELASGMAHEIRNPLTTIKGFLQISKANGYNIENWYKLIMDEINRMSELTAEFLQFSKPRSTQFSVHSLHECVLRVISLTESEATRLGHQIFYEYPEGPMPIVMDQDKMVQLLLNLVKNAYEAMNENGHVRLSMTRQKDFVLLEIQDTGQGIPPDQLEKIFHPFYTTKESGTGLGLSICHKIVQDHQGTLEVESIVNEGTRFIITFPLGVTDENFNFQNVANN
jgi:diguanylate cyclase (GGDEF)-like protein